MKKEKVYEFAEDLFFGVRDGYGLLYRLSLYHKYNI